VQSERLHKIVSRFLLRDRKFYYLLVYLSAYRSVLREWSQHVMPGDIMAIWTNKDNDKINSWRREKNWYNERTPIFQRNWIIDRHLLPLMWSDTIRLRKRPVWDQTIGLGLGLAGLVLCWETRSCHARRHNDLERHINFSSTIYSISILCLEHQYCGDQPWRSLT